MPQQQQFHSGDSGAERRYDAETMQRVIATATRLQQAHRETVSIEQIEEIGREVGLDPVFVRQALDAVEGEAVVAAKPSQVAATEAVVLPKRRTSGRGKTVRRSRRAVAPLTGTQILSACAPGLAYGIYAALAFASAPGSRGELVLFLGVLQTAALAFVLGWSLRHRRLAAISGGVLGLSSVIAIILAQSAPSRSEDLLPVALFMLVASGLSIGGAAARNWYDAYQEMIAAEAAEEEENSDSAVSISPVTPRYLGPQS